MTEIAITGAASPPKARKKTRTLPGGFRKGEPVPEWLLSRAPMWPWSKPGRIYFAEDCVFIANWRHFHVKPLRGETAIVVKDFKRYSFYNRLDRRLHVGDDFVFERSRPWNRAEHWLLKALFGPFVKPSGEGE